MHAPLACCLLHSPRAILHGRRPTAKTVETGQIFFADDTMTSTPAYRAGAHPLRRSGSAAIGLMLAVLVNGKGAVYLLVCRTKGLMFCDLCTCT